jgi:hypothetical protein
MTIEIILHISLKPILGIENSHSVHDMNVGNLEPNFRINDYTQATNKTIQRINDYKATNYNQASRF